MPNLLEMLRLKNLFGGDMGSPDMGMPDSGNLGMPQFTNPMDTMDSGNLGGPSPWSHINFGPTEMNTPQPAMGAPGGYDVASRMAQIYHPEHDASDRFDALAKGYPTRPEPSGMRKLSGALLGSLSDIADLTNGPGTGLGGRTDHSGKFAYDEITGKNTYNEKVADWKNQIGPAQAAANLERYTNSNERTAAYQTVANELRQHAQEAKDKNDASNAQIRGHRADIYEFKAKNPGMKIITPKGGNIQMVDPITGVAKDTGIPSGSLTDLDKINLNAEDKMTQIEATGDQRRQTVAAQGDEARKTKETVGGGTLKPDSPSGVKGELPTQTRVRQYTNAEKLINSDPEARKFVKLDPASKSILITPSNPSAWTASGRGPSKEQIDQWNQTIYGDNSIPINQPGRTGAPTGPSGVPVNKPNMGTAPLTHGEPAGNAGPQKQKFSGKRVVIYKNGQPAGTIPEEQADLAKTKGYEVR